MKQKKDKIRKIVHNIRSELSVMQMMFDVIEPSFEDSDEGLLYEESKKCFKGMLQKFQNLVDEIYSIGSDHKSIPGISIKTAPDIISDLPNNNVLVIDDSETIRKQFKYELVKRGKNVVTLEKGEDLLETPINLNDFSVVVVDYEFENSALDGFDIVEYLKNQKVKRIHMCTGCYDDPGVIKRAQELGVVSIISKPIPARFWEIV